MRHGYVIELKYLKRGEPAGEARVARAAQEAVAQVRRTWPTSGWHGSIRRCALPGWPSWFTAGNWYTPAPCPRPAKQNRESRGMDGVSLTVAQPSNDELVFRLHGGEAVDADHGERMNVTAATSLNR